MSQSKPIFAQAAICDGRGGFTIGTIEVGPPAAGEVRIAIHASGLCHTDYDSLNWGYTFVMGHEGAGIVESIGPGVTHVSPGDAVVLNWAIPCKTCFQCQDGNQNLCETYSPVTGQPDDRGMAHGKATRWNGMALRRSFNIGTLSSHTVVRKEAVIRLTTDIPFASACILGCGVMTGVGSVINAARLKPGSSAVVLGTGGVGLNVIQGARIAGAGRIIAIDVNSQRLEMAKRFGATDCILSAPEDTGLRNAAAEVPKFCGGRGADYAFECTGIPELGAAPLAMVRNGGVAVQVSGIEQTIEMDMKLFEWDKIYMNPLYGKSKPDQDFPKLMQFYDRGLLRLDEMVTRTYALTSLQEAIDDMLAGRNAKGVVLFDHKNSHYAIGGGRRE